MVWPEAGGEPQRRGSPPTTTVTTTRTTAGTTPAPTGTAPGSRPDPGLLPEPDKRPVPQRHPLTVPTTEMTAPSRSSWRLAEGEPIAPSLLTLGRLGGGHAYEAYRAWSEHLYAHVVAKVVRPDQVEDPRSCVGPAARAAAPAGAAALLGAALPRYRAGRASRRQAQQRHHGFVAPADRLQHRPYDSRCRPSTRSSGPTTTSRRSSAIRPPRAAPDLRPTCGGWESPLAAPAGRAGTIAPAAVAAPVRACLDRDPRTPTHAR